ncbi:hypothetical protein NliqN6_2561 [Naganishia liquefaciens]|uniref:BZIP domain-containing protein n=1 Tax=Naganishia liquefaciens TaxID=104408 RepID=A0A8H3TSE5_9TREE|nr:hypothetical protein NliqN6_2561 [Naganishia liquefaciens]
MQVEDSQVDSCTYQAIPVYAANPAHGLQPAALIYEPDPQDFLNQRLICDDISTGYFSMPRKLSTQMSNPFAHTYPYHPSNSVSLSAIQPFESCLPPSIITHTGPNDYPQYLLPSSVTTVAPDNGAASLSGQLSVDNGLWTNSAMPVSLEYPYDIQSFYVNSDGTKSDVWSSTVTPPIHQNARLNNKRSSEEMTEQMMDPPSGSHREKRQRLGMRVNTNLGAMELPDSSPASSNGTADDNMQRSPSVPEVCTPPPTGPQHLRPRKLVDYNSATPTTSPNDSRRAISAAARAQSITDHVLEIYRSYAKPKEGADGDTQPPVGALPFIEGYEPVLPAFPELSGDEMALSDEDDESESAEQSPVASKRKGGKRSPKSGRGQDKVSNRVAARRHREMTKERLKNLEKLRSWLDEALAEYEKSNRMLQNNYQQLQQENYTLQRSMVIPL